MEKYAYSLPAKKYGVILFDLVGEPIHDRPHCAKTIKEACEIALSDMDEHPFSCATVYMRGPTPVRFINCARKIKKA